MSSENLRGHSFITDRIKLELQNGEVEKAMDLLAQNYGPIAKNLFEKVVNSKILQKDELARLFGKISDLCENCADKMDKNVRMQAQKEETAQKEAKEEAKEDIERTDDMMQARAERFNRIADTREYIREEARRRNQPQKPKNLYYDKPKETYGVMRPAPTPQHDFTKTNWIALMKKQKFNGK